MFIRKQESMIEKQKARQEARERQEEEEYVGLLMPQMPPMPERQEEEYVGPFDF